MDAVTREFTHLLTSQLESQRAWFEDLRAQDAAQHSARIAELDAAAARHDQAIGSLQQRCALPSWFSMLAINLMYCNLVRTHICGCPYLYIVAASFCKAGAGVCCMASQGSVILSPCSHVLSYGACGLGLLLVSCALT